MKREDVMRLAMQHKLVQGPREDWAAFEKRVRAVAKPKRRGARRR